MNPVKKLRFYIHRIEQLEEKCTELAACVEKLTKSTEELQKMIEEQSAKYGMLQSLIEKNQWERFWRVYSEWWSWGATPSLLREFNYIERFDVFWENELHDLWLIYICCLLENDEKQHAINVLKKYINRFGTENVERYLPVANLYAQSVSGCPEQILDAQKVYEGLQKRQQGQIFEDYIRKGRSIAVVGNSDREVGKGQGKSIDAHDVVIRFNDYTGKAAADYGCKTTVWVRNGSPDCPDMSTAESYDFVIWADDYLHTYVQGNLLGLMCRDIESKVYTAAMISPESHRKLREKADLLNPTSGAYMIYYLYEILGSLSNVDFYGFSFLDDAVSETDCHASELLNWHEMSAEVPFLRSLITKLR